MAGFSPELVQRALAAMRSVGILPESATPQNAAETVGQYASEGGPFRPSGPAAGITSNVAQGLVTTPQAFGFNGNPTNDINRMAGMMPTPMGGPSGPAMGGARAGGAGLLSRPTAMAAPSGLLDTSRLDKSRLDEDGNRIMEDPSMGGHEFDLDRMERSANEYLARRGDLPAGIPDEEVGPRVADHFNRTSQGYHQAPAQYKEMGIEHLFDMQGHRQLAEKGYGQPAAAYVPQGAEAIYENGAIRIIDRDPGMDYFKQLAEQKNRAGMIDPTKLRGLLGQ